MQQQQFIIRHVTEGVRLFDGFKFLQSVFRVDWRFTEEDARKVDLAWRA